MRLMGRAGFTLIEVVTALVITALVALLANRLLTVTVDSLRQLDRSRIALDRESNGFRWLRSAFLSLEAGGAAGDFEGAPERMGFSTWLLQPEGWFGLTRLSLEVDQGRLTARTATGQPVVLRDSVADLRFDYLLEPGANTRWVQAWRSPLSAPVAVRLRIARLGQAVRVDTLLFLIRGRG